MILLQIVVEGSIERGSMSDSVCALGRGRCLDFQKMKKGLMVIWRWRGRLLDLSAKTIRLETAHKSVRLLLAGSEASRPL